MPSNRETGLFKDTAGVWRYDFRVRGTRFQGSCFTRVEREAVKIVKARKAEAEAKIDIGVGPRISFGVATTRWWNEVGQYRKKPDDLKKRIGWLQAQIGLNAQLVDIKTSTIARLIEARRQDAVSAGTINRTVVELMRRILNYSASVWEADLSPIKWREIKLKEPRGRKRRMSADEGAALWAKLGEHYRAPFVFALLSGCRLNEIVTLSWAAIDWGEKRITIHGKDDKIETIPISGAIQDLLWPVQGRHPEAVFCFLEKIGRGRLQRVEWRPITYNGLSTAWHRARTAAGIKSSADDLATGLRFHDLRRTALSKIGDPVLARDLARHDNIETTMRYYHRDESDVRDAMDRLSSFVDSFTGKSETEKPKAIKEVS